MPRPIHERNSAQPTKRGSLPRLSSLASLQAFNPFTRRRSNNNLSPDKTFSHSSSTLSLTQSRSHRTSNDDAPSQENNVPQTLPIIESDSSRLTAQVSTSPIHGRLPPRQRSRQQLSAQANQHLPRSSTLSNLPLPVKNDTDVSRSKVPQSRRQSQQKLISSRIPSPPTTNRKHSATVSKFLCDKSPRLKRSGTEPLLENAAATVGKADYKRSARVFKENFRISPGQKLPYLFQEVEKTDLYGSSPPLAKDILVITPSDREMPPIDETLQSDNSNIVTLRCELSNSSLQFQNTSCQHESRGRLRTTPSTNLQSVHQWSSPPIIDTMMVAQPQAQSEAQQRSDESEAQSKASRKQYQITTYEEEASGSIRGNRLPSSGSFKPLPTPPSRKTLGEIDTYEPIEFWAGRLVAVCDRYRNEELRQVLSFPEAKEIRPDSSSSEKMHSAEAAIARQRRALEALYIKCTTEDATNSLIAFQQHISAINGHSDLAKPFWGTNSMLVESNGIRLRTSGADLVVASSSARRRAFIDRLLGNSSLKTAKAGDVGTGSNGGGKRLSWV